MRIKINKSPKTMSFLTSIVTLILSYTSMNAMSSGSTVEPEVPISISNAAPVIVKEYEPFWATSQGPFGGLINSIVIDSQGNLFVATGDRGCNGYSCGRNGIFRSIDGGQTWAAANYGLDNVHINSLVINSFDEIYAGAYLGPIYKSMDNGQTWIALTIESERNQMFDALAVDSKDTVFAGTRSGIIYRSTDGGINWQEIDLDIGSIRVLFVDRYDTIFVLGYQLALRSIDGGDNWESIPSLERYYLNSMIEISRGELLVAGALGVNRSTDGGRSWQFSDHGLPGNFPDVKSLVQADNGDIIAGLEKNGYYRSTDRGLTWEQTGSSAERLAIHGLVCSHIGTLFAGTDGGVFSSEDMGQTWLARNQGLTNAIVNALVVLEEGTSYAGTDSGVYKTTNLGITWTNASEGLPRAIGISALIEDFNGDLIAGTEAAEIYRSQDEGKTWHALGKAAHAQPDLDNPIRAIVRDNHGNLFVSTGDGFQNDGIFRSQDGGQSWIQLTQGLPSRFVVHTLMVTNSGAVIAGGNEGIYLSLNSGQIWKLVYGEGNTIWEFAQAPDNGILAATRRGILGSFDGGMTWETISGAPQTWIQSIAISESGTVYAGRFNLQPLQSRSPSIERLEYDSGSLFPIEDSFCDNIFVTPLSIAIGPGEVVCAGLSGGSVVVHDPNAVGTWLPRPPLPFEGGTGGPYDPYQISTAEQLISIGSDPNLLDKSFILTSPIDMSGYVFETSVLAPDTDNSNWSHDGLEFTGSFDGAGLTISNLTIHAPGQKNDYLGLFGAAAMDASIQNVVLENVLITGGDAYIGGLAGQISGTIERCCAKGTVNGVYQVGLLVGVNLGKINESCAEGTVNGNGYVGGLVGFNTHDVSGCYSNCAVMGKYYSGGFVGENRGYIDHSYAFGVITGKTKSSDLGGFAGSNTGSISYCYAAVLIKAGSSHPSIGGFIGDSWYDSYTIHCYWDKDVTGIGHSDGGFARSSVQMKNPVTYVGWHDGDWIIEPYQDYPHLFWEEKSGIIIHNDTERYYHGSGTESDPFRLTTAEDIYCMSRRSQDWNSHFLITNDIDMSSVTDYLPPMDFRGVINGNGFVIQNLTIIEPTSFVGFIGGLGQGGIIKNLGLEECDIHGYRITGSIAGAVYESSILNCYSISEVNGIDFSRQLGGLVGYTVGGNVTSSFSRGVVSVGIETSYIGGLIGNSYAGAITRECYSHCKVLAGESSKDIGGLIGQNTGASVYDCYSTGLVSSGDSSFDIGGLIGRNYNSNIVVNCYWDMETSGLGYSDGGFGRSTEQMKQGSTYIGWSEGSWFIDEGNDYPHLPWEGSIGTEIDNIPLRSYKSTGTINDPYFLISAEYINCMFRRPMDWSKHFILGRSIDVSSLTNYQSPCHFTGTINGRGHAIKDLVISERSSFAGFIGYLGGGQIRNLRLEGVNVKGFRHVGGLVGLSKKGSIYNCSVEGSVRGENESRYLRLLVGKNDTADISLCYTVGSVVGGKYSSQLGGLVGGNVYRSKIKDCYSWASLECDENGRYLGGLIGYS